MASAGLLARIIEGLFFQTDKRTYWDFNHFGLRGEHVRFSGPNHSILAGMFLPAFFTPDITDRRPKGTILYAHACIHNMRFHLPQVIWLVAHGFQVFTYDPRGCGQSEGEIDLQTITEDALAAYRYITTREDVDCERIVLFGQNAGAAALLSLANEHTNIPFKGIVLESIWATNTGYLLHRYGPGIGHLCAKLLPKRNNPIDALKKLRIPLAIAVAGKDESIPEAEISLVMKASPKHREIWLENGARHLHIFPQPSESRARMLAFLNNALNA